MAYWLKLIGTLENPITEYADEYVDYSVHHKDYILNGDQMILYATGQKVIFASADVISDPYPSNRPRWPFRVDIKYRNAVPVHPGIDVTLIADRNHKLLFDLQHQSFIPISQGEFNRGDQILSAESGNS